MDGTATWQRPRVGWPLAEALLATVVTVLITVPVVAGWLWNAYVHSFGLRPSLWRCALDLSAVAAVASAGVVAARVSEKWFLRRGARTGLTLLTILVICVAPLLSEWMSSVLGAWPAVTGVRVLAVIASLALAGLLLALSKHPATGWHPGLAGAAVGALFTVVISQLS